METMEALDLFFHQKQLSRQYRLYVVEESLPDSESAGCDLLNEKCI